MPPIRRTKIVCTIGPASSSLSTLRQLILAGMDVARINCSHGDFSEHSQNIQKIRQLAKECRRPISILLDLPGTKIRIGSFQKEPVLLQKNAFFTLTRRETLGNEQEVHLPTPEVFEAVKPGHHIFLGDGLIELRVEKVTDTDILCKVITGGELSSKKGLVIPNVSLPLPLLTPADCRAIAFGAEHGVDWIAASFIRKAEDILEVKRCIAQTGREIPVIAKIEKQEAVKNLKSILEVADGIMVARGDLGVDMPIHEVPMVQKEIIALSNHCGKPVITATQMLDSMVHNPRPTRAEVTDVANAVFDGTDAVMLSAETAVGRYPVESVRLMARIVAQAEAHLNWDQIFMQKLQERATTITDAISEATCTIARDLRVSAILTATTSGYTARMISRYRPKMPIIAVTWRCATYHQLALVWGVRPLFASRPLNAEEYLQKAVDTALENRFIRRGDLVVMTAGFPMGIPGNTNLVRVVRV